MMKMVVAVAMVLVGDDDGDANGDDGGGSEGVLGEGVR